jgi:hypothetical protein
LKNPSKMVEYAMSRGRTGFDVSGLRPARRAEFAGDS